MQCSLRRSNPLFSSFVHLHRDVVHLDSVPSQFYPVVDTEHGLPIAYFGGDRFSVQCLNWLWNRKRPWQSIQCVVPPTLHHPPPLLQFARENEIPYITAPIKTLKGWQPCFSEPKPLLAVVVSFDYFLPSSLLSQFPFGAINVHPSLLPRYRGASPLLQALIEDDVVTGVTVQRLHATQFDAGSILRQEAIILTKENRNIQTLGRILAEKGAQLLESILSEPNYWFSRARPQQGALMRAPKVKRSTSFLDPLKQTPEEAVRLFEALDRKPCQVQDALGRLVFLLDICLPSVALPTLSQPGFVHFHSGEMYLCMKPTCYGLEWLQIKSLRVKAHPLTAKAYWMGYQPSVHSSWFHSCKLE